MVPKQDDYLRREHSIGIIGILFSGDKKCDIGKPVVGGAVRRRSIVQMAFLNGRLGLNLIC